MGRSIILFIAVLVAAAGCSGGSDLEATPVDVHALETALETAISVDGDEPVAVWFTTPWCRQCDAQLRDALTAAATQCDHQVVVVIGRAGEGAIGQFIDANPVPTSCPDPPAIVIDSTGEAFGAVPVVTAPTWVFVDGDTVAVERSRLDVDAVIDRLAPS
ncbi:MAG: hypothetical protein ACR2QE_11785 [Acidimicrobiales bacterium]